MDQHRTGNSTAKGEWLLPLLPSLMMMFGKSRMFIVRKFQFPVHIFASYSHLSSDSTLGHFLASLQELSLVEQTAGHAAASFSLLLSSSGPQWWQLSWLLISGLTTLHLKASVLQQPWHKDFGVSQIFHFCRDHGPVSFDHFPHPLPEPTNPDEALRIEVRIILFSKMFSI